MNHLNEDKLIQFAFGLLEEDAKDTAQLHMDACGDCRDALAALQAKFAAMDVLADEVPPSEALIKQTLATKNNAKNIPLYRRWWVEWSAAAAAVALVCILMLQNLSDTQVTEPVPEISKDTLFATKSDAPQLTDDSEQKPPPSRSH